MSEALDNARALVAKANGFRDATEAHDLPAEGSIIGLWLATAGALEALLSEHERLTAPPPDDEREALAREVYRSFYPGDVNTPDSMRSAESDAREFDRAYKTWDAGREGYAPGGACRRAADRIMASPVWRNRHRGPITDAEAVRLGKVAWVAYQGDPTWASSVVEDCFSPADDLPEEALDMIAVARAVVEAAGAGR